MRALLAVASILMMIALVGVSYLALNDLLNPYQPNKAGAAFLWFVFFVPTVALIHFAWFRDNGDSNQRSGDR